MSKQFLSQPNGSRYFRMHAKMSPETSLEPLLPSLLTGYDLVKTWLICKAFLYGS